MKRLYIFVFILFFYLACISQSPEDPQKLFSDFDSWLKENGYDEKYQPGEVDNDYMLRQIMAAREEHLRRRREEMRKKQELEAQQRMEAEARARREEAERQKAKAEKERRIAEQRMRRQIEDQEREARKRHDAEEAARLQAEKEARIEAAGKAAYDRVISIEKPRIEARYHEFEYLAQGDGLIQQTSAIARDGIGLLPASFVNVQIYPAPNYVTDKNYPVSSVAATDKLDAAIMDDRSDEFFVVDLSHLPSPEELQREIDAIDSELAKIQLMKDELEKKW